MEPVQVKREAGVDGLEVTHSFVAANANANAVARVVPFHHFSQSYATTVDHAWGTELVASHAWY